MKQNSKKSKPQGKEAFEKYYSDIYTDRWEKLKESLFKENIHAEINAGGSEKYYLDPGSVCAAMTLPLSGGKKILDLCAAPGGKTLILSMNMDSDANLSSNERSPDRKARLAKVVQNVLPEEISTRVLTSCSDGATWCRRETESFDRILLDVPCSSERHVIQDPKYLNDWTQSRIKTLSMEQWALVSSAWRLLKKDGFMVYSTCAMNPIENDEIIAKLFKKFDDCELVDSSNVEQTIKENLLKTGQRLTLPLNIDILDLYNKADKTKFGHHILPDTTDGAGPLFFTLLHKKSFEITE